MLNGNFAALLPCSPAKGQRRRVLGGYVSPLWKTATLILKKIRTILGGPQEAVGPKGVRGNSGPVCCAGISLDAAVRAALRQCVDDAVPPLSSEEFDRLYCRILDNMFITGGEGAAYVIDTFMNERKK